MGFGKYPLPNTQTPIYITREPKTSERIAYQIRVRSKQEEHPCPEMAALSLPATTARVRMVWTVPMNTLWQLQIYAIEFS
jgi:hypothetical protein